MELENKNLAFKPKGYGGVAKFLDSKGTTMNCAMPPPPCPKV